MATARFQVRTDTSPLREAVMLINRGLEEATDTGPFGAMRRQWAARYSAWIREVFVRNSLGDGDWPPLKASTLLRRRHGKNKVRVVRRSKRGNILWKPSVRTAILRDTGVLFGALIVGAYGNETAPIQGGIMFGFSDLPHDKSGTSVAKIASYHQSGGGTLPQRKILRGTDEIDPSVLRAMAEDAGRAAMKCFPPRGPR